MNEAKQLQLRGGDSELSRVLRSRRRPKYSRVAEQTWLETGSLASQSNQDSSRQLCLQGDQNLQQSSSTATPNKAAIAAIHTQQHA